MAYHRNGIHPTHALVPSCKEKLTASMHPSPSGRVLEQTGWLVGTLMKQEGILTELLLKLPGRRSSSINLSKKTNAWMFGVISILASRVSLIKTVNNLSQE